MVVCFPLGIFLRRQEYTRHLGVFLPSVLFTALAMLEVLLEMGNQPVWRRYLALAAAVGKGLFGCNVCLVFMFAF